MSNARVISVAILPALLSHLPTRSPSAANHIIAAIDPKETARISQRLEAIHAAAGPRA